MSASKAGSTGYAGGNRWYLNIMSPNTKGEKFAWLDPTSIYINGDAFHDLLDDLVADLETVTCDVVGGLDAMGFVLGSALATRLGVGFLPIRKAGKLCVDTDSTSFSNYSSSRDTHSSASNRNIPCNQRCRKLCGFLRISNIVGHAYEF